MNGTTSGVGAGRKAGSSALVQTNCFSLTISRKQQRFTDYCPSGERMTVRKIPPGRKSISHLTVTQGNGVAHCLTCSGSVITLHRRLGGALHDSLRGNV